LEIAGSKLDLFMKNAPLLIQPGLIRIDWSVGHATEKCGNFVYFSTNGCLLFNKGMNYAIERNIIRVSNIFL